MPDINIEEDLTSINEQIVKVVDELNKVNAARENLIQQVQNLNGVAMYLRGKIQDANPDAPMKEAPTMVEGTDDLERTTEYPEDSTT
tara:strand:- start:1746 stop:2006 length:261 start_codon:yes stop_codon:yes gene_type:complete